MRKYSSALLSIISIVIILLFIYYAFASYFYIWPLSGFDDRNELGAFGDSWGALTSLFSALACIGVYAAWIEQKKATEQALQDSRAQSNFLHAQRVESNFFQMMNYMQSMISDMDINAKDKNGSVITLRSGRDCFDHLLKKLKVEFEKSKFNGIPLSNNKEKHKEVVLSIYDKIYVRFSNDLSNYFRFLYSIFRYIECSGLPNEDVEKYAKILRAQISDSELCFLFYNMLSERGEKFMPLAIKYELFDNLPDYSLLQSDHVYLLPKKALGMAAKKYDNSLFDS